MPIVSSNELLWEQYTGRNIPSFSDDLDILPVWGQSLALGVVGTSLLRNEANKLDRFAVQMLRGLFRADGFPNEIAVNGPMTGGYNAAIPTTGISNAVATGNIATVLYMAAALRIRRAANALANPRILTCCNAIGGQAIARFTNPPGETIDYTESLWSLMNFWTTQADNAVADRPVRVPYAVFIQGEADSNAALGAYRAGMDAMWDDWLPLWDKFGADPLPCTTQVGGYADSLLNKTYNPVIEQIQCVEALGGLILAPWYPVLLEDGNIHPGDPGYRLGADLCAYHLVEHEAGRTIPAFKPTTQVVGNQIILTYPLRSGETLTLDESGKYTSYGGFCPNFGFETPGATITSVELGVGGTVVITCASPPTSWRYAFQFQDVSGTLVNGATYSAHRGLLRKTDAIQSVLGQGSMYQWALSWRQTGI